MTPPEPTPINPKPSWLTQGLIALVRLYQIVTVGMPHRCRFYPSCSRYMIEALQGHKLFAGLWLTLKRLGRCHPFAPWSPETAVDPVPPSPLSSFTL